MSESSKNSPCLLPPEFLPFRRTSLLNLQHMTPPNPLSLPQLPLGLLHHRKKQVPRHSLHSWNRTFPSLYITIRTLASGR